MNKNEQLSKYYQRCDELLLKENLKDLLQKAKNEVEEIEVDDIDLENMILIDVRENDEFASGVIPSNVLLTIPRGKLEFMAIKKIAEFYGQDAHIVTYCLKGPRGSLAGYQLKKMGFTNVKNLKGGILNWLDKGNTIHSYLGELTLAK